ncbi:MAG: 50S ribosomal protein L21 [Clostridia bacterium]|nr:50S ribosomal protein L21 [Clostridia bacterium]MBR3196330.1 50S ribosomal protein L21 [Clostridia bacterium]
MNAVIKTGGKQYSVKEGDVIYVEKLGLEKDAEVDFDVLMISDGENSRIGTPIVDGASVKAKVLGDVKGEKIVIFKYKSKKTYRKTQGHRQPYTKLEIVSINA